MTEQHTEWWRKHGYLAGRQLATLEGDYWIVLMPMITTYRLALCTPDSVLDFYCYPHELGQAAPLAAYEAWDGRSDPLPGWVKHHATGRRRRLVDGVWWALDASGQPIDELEPT